jgi:heat shock protein HslJ
MLRNLFWGAVVALPLALTACAVTVQPPDGGTATPSDEQTPAPAAGLIGPTWEWVETVYGDGTVVAAADPSRYTLTFGADGQVAAQLDCNSGGGSYSVDGEELVFGALASTLMGCPSDSQDYVFSQDLSAVVAWAVEDGALRLALADDGGTMHFRAAP